MIVREFLWWMQKAPADLRAEATRDLVECYLWGEIDASDRDATEAAMISLLDDNSPLVRLALAESLAHHEHAPAIVISGLARDYAEISSIILQYSPVLSECELIEITEISSSWQHAAIAARSNLTWLTAKALAEYASSEICHALMQRPDFAQSSELIDIILSRFGDLGEIREALLQSGNLTHEQHVILVSKATDHLQNFIAMTGWLKPERNNRFMRDTSDRAFLITLKNATTDQVIETAVTLQEAGKLTPSLLLRALLSGQRSFFETTLAFVTGLDLARVSGLLKDKSGRSTNAILTKAGIPQTLIPCFEIILATNTVARSTRDGLNLRYTNYLLSEYQQHGSFCDQSVLSLLQHFNTEAARDEARYYTSDLIRKNEDQTILEENTHEGWFDNEEVVEFNENPANDVVEDEIDALELFKQEMLEKELKKAA